MKAFILGLATLFFILVPQHSVEAPTKDNPKQRDEMFLAIYIKDSHYAMNQLLPHLGQEPTRYPLSWARAKYYSDRLIDEVNRRGLGDHFLWDFVIPYIDQGTGFINGLNDKHLKKPSIGLFEIRPDTARWLVYRCQIAEERVRAGKTARIPEALVGKHSDKIGWLDDEQWIKFLIYELKEAGADDAISFGMDLLELYQHEFKNTKGIFSALVAGPEGTKNGVAVEMQNFYQRQRKARKFHNFVTGEA